MKWLSLLYLATLAACTKTNPAYCTAPADCPSGACDVAEHRCMSGSGDGGHDAQLPDAQLGCRGPADCHGSTPVCLGGDAGMGGMCVECGASDDCHDAAKPFCGSNNTCVRCAMDVQCTARSDNMGVALCEDGRCPTPSEVAFVDGVTAGDCSTRTGTPALPYCALDTALATDATHAMFFLKPGGTHRGAIIQGRNVTIFGRKTEVTTTSRYFFDIKDAHVTLRGLLLDNNMSTTGGGTPDGVTVFCEGSGSVCKIEDSVIEKNLGVGVRVQAGALELRRSTLDRNFSGALDLQNAAGFQVENNVFFKNGHGNSGGISSQQFGAINIDTLSLSGPANLVNNTFFDNHAEPSGGGSTWSASITCAFVGTRAVTIANSIFWHNAPVRIGASNTVQCAARASLTDDPMATAASNKTGDPLFKSELTPVDLHLMPLSPAKDGADPTVAPADDLDGKKRDTLPDMGADEVDTP